MKKKNKKAAGMLLGRIMVFVLAAVAGLGFYYYNAQDVVGNPLPMPFGYGAAVVLSGSMEPTVSMGDLVFVKETADYQEGDIVVYQELGILVMHRIISVEGDTVITQGDANNIADAPIHKDQIRGIVFGWIPAAGKVVQWIKHPVGIIVILAAAVILFELPYRQQKEKDQEDLEAIKDEIRKLKEETAGGKEGL